MHLRADGGTADLRFSDLADLLRPGDLLVVNETRVVKARLRGGRSNGKPIELLVLSADAEGNHQVLAKPAKRLKPGDRLTFAEAGASVVGPGVIRFDPDVDVDALMERTGETPLPPYITPPPDLDVERAYQPVFARVAGSVAAPTASLHFTEALLERIRARGVEIAPLVLTVGLGTFAPVRVERLSDHEMHEEQFVIPEATADAIRRTRAAGGRIVAVGTTVVRALESSVTVDGDIRAGAGATRLFIRDGFIFRAVDALITNFHVPRSTLLVLVSTFAGRDAVLRAYRHAVEQRYRFFSFGDAMFIEAASREPFTGRQE